jgi:hypothetical protein
MQPRQSVMNANETVTVTDKPCSWVFRHLADIIILNDLWPGVAQGIILPHPDSSEITCGRH